MTVHAASRVWFLLGLLVVWPAFAAAQDAGASTEPEAPRAEIHTLVTPEGGVKLGEIVKLTITAEVAEGDEVTLPEQTFGSFEVHDTARRKRSPRNGRQTFVFELQLQAFEAKTVVLEDLHVRIVTREGQIAQQAVPPVEIEVASLVGNEPNAQLKPESDPVVVMEDDYTLAYVGGGLLAVLAIAGLTLLVQRYLRNRPVAAPPPPPPRPPWEIAVEHLAALRRRKQAMVEGGQAVEFVDEVSDVVRAYLGGRFGFPGLDTTTEELLEHLRVRRVQSGLQEEARAYLRRCDLVKFAKVTPDEDEVDLIFAKAQDIVQFSIPNDTGGPDHHEPSGPAFAEQAR